jgi:uncharacterized protein (DUF1330 family)
MRTNYKLAMGILAGIAAGFAGGAAIHARPPQPPAGYVVAEVEVNDSTTFQKYSAQVPGTLAPFGAHYIIRGGRIEGIEGEPPKQRFVVIAFDTFEKAKAWEESPAYSAIKGIRHSSAKSRVFIAEGVAAQ